MQNNWWKQQGVLKRAAAVWLAGVMAVSLTGCGGSGGGKSAGGGTSGSGDASGEREAMGRYVETMMDVDTGEIMDLRELEGGKLVLLENGAAGRFISEDDGVTWKPDQLPGWHDLAMGYYIYDMKAACDGSVAILCESYDGMYEEEDESEAEEETAGEAVNDEDSETDQETADEADEKSADNENEDRKSKIYFIPAQGEAKWFDVPDSEYGMMACLCFSEDGSRLFVADMDSKIYEVDRETGNAKLFLAADIIPDMLCVWDNYMAVKNERDGVALYALDTAERIEDDVITEFVMENCVVNKQVVESTYSIFPAEEAGVYLVCDKGV